MENIVYIEWENLLYWGLNMSNIVKYKMKLEVLTPLHIGGADYKSKLDKKEYVFDKDKRTLTLIDTEKIVAFLMKKNLFDEYIFHIQKNVNFKRNEQDRNIKLIDFLKKNNIYKNIEEFRKKAPIKVDINIENMNDIKLMTRNVLGKQYIPGSSIKGALVNFLLVDYIIKHRNEFEKEKKLILDEAKKVSNKNQANSFRNNIMKNIVNIVEDYILYSKNMEYSVKKRMNYKINKEEEYIFYKGNSGKKLGISISDSCSYTDIKTNFYQDYDEKIGKEIEPGAMPLSREYIMANSKFNFDIILDIDILKKSKLEIKNIDDLIEALENATTYLINNVLEDRNSLQTENLILGANTGFHQKTIVHALFKDKSERTQVVKVLLHKGGTNGIRLHLNDKDSPRVINRIRKNGKLELAGLVEIRKISEKEVGK